MLCAISQVLMLLLLCDWPALYARIRESMTDHVMWCARVLHNVDLQDDVDVGALVHGADMHALV